MKIIAISDVHNQIDKIKLPDDCEILIIAGDFSGRGTRKELINFNDELGKIKHKFKHIIGVQGNHEMALANNLPLVKSLLFNMELLHDTSTIIKGINFYGSPYSPEFCGWAFGLPRGEAIRKKWLSIPDDTQFLITHGPPFGILDVNDEGIFGEHVGCEELLKAINARPSIKCVVVGHIHSGYGHTYQNNKHFINASSCRNNYQPTNPPIVVEFDDVADVANYKITQYIEE